MAFKSLDSRYVIAKYIADPMRMEPKNIGVIVWSGGLADAMFLGERRLDSKVQLDARSIPSFVTSRSAYKQWLQYWRSSISKETFEPPKGGAPVSVASSEFIDALVLSGKGNFALTDAGVILEPVSEANIQDVTYDLFRQLVATSVEPTEVEEERNIQRICDRIISETHVSADTNFKRGYSVRHKVGSATINLDLDYAYKNGAMRRAYRRVPLPESRRDREHSILSSLYVFDAILDSGVVKGKDSLVALVGPKPSQRDSADMESYLAALSNSARIIDVGDRDEAVSEFESLKQFSH